MHKHCHIYYLIVIISLVCILAYSKNYFDPIRINGSQSESPKLTIQSDTRALVEGYHRYFIVKKPDGFTIELLDKKQNKQIAVLSQLKLSHHYTAYNNGFL